MNIMGDNYCEDNSMGDNYCEYNYCDYDNTNDCNVVNYRYLLEENANKNISFNDFQSETDTITIFILCYHIETQHKYPFLQFMMNKIPFCNNFVKEELTLPYVTLKDRNSDILTIVLDKVKTSLLNLNCEHIKVTDDMYKGILFGEDCSTPYALVNISGIDIYGLHFGRNSPSWFVLSSELINTKTVCNIPVNDTTIDFFTDNQEIGILRDKITNRPFMLPDAAYTGAEFRVVEFRSVFGNHKSKIYENCGEYFYFYRSFGEAIKDGVWLKTGASNKIGNRVIVENNSNKYIRGGINRYAVFVEGKTYMESTGEFSLTDNIIDNLYPEPCILICYSGEHKVNPDILVKNTENFVCLSFHTLNKTLFPKTYDEKLNKEYMIA